MNDILRIHSKETTAEEKKIQIEELKDFPDSINALFEKLPDSLKDRILTKTRKSETVNFPEGHKRRFEEEIAAIFDTKTRERFMISCLDELFNNGRFKSKFEAVGEENLQQEIERLLDVLWQNRGEHGNVRLFNHEYYDVFFQTRNVIAEKIKAKKREIEKLNDSIATTIKQKRLTERKQEDMRKLEAEMGLLVNELKEYDDRHDNSDFDRMYSRDVSSRQRREKEWTNMVAITSEYLDPAEFATVMAEQLDRTFHLESLIARNPERKLFGRTPPKDAVERALKIVQSIAQAIENWHTAHENDGSYKKASEMKLDERRAKLIDYLISLMASYQSGKEIKRTDDDMLYTIRQMEVTLTILGK